MKFQISVMMICLVLAVSQVQAARIKIQLTKESAELYRAHIFKRQASGGSCTDNMVVNRSSLTLPGRLNELDDRVTFYRSAMATSNLDMFQNMLVAGLGGLTVRDVFDVLRNNGCLPFFFGGAVRDQYLNKPPNDADVEIDCSIQTFYSVCMVAWGPTNCRISVGRPVGHVGNETVEPNLQRMDLASTEITFYAPLKDLEYTVNSMAYDLNGNDVIIDLTGAGQVDACNKHIRIPSDDGSIESWNLWVTESKVFRFWKLRTKDLIAFNDATLDFIVNEAKRLIQNDPNTFPVNYCSIVYGSRYSTTDKTCTADQQTCEDGRANSQTFNAAFAEDFGSYWNSTIVPDLLPACGALSIEYSLRVIAGLIFVVVFGFL